MRTTRQIVKANIKKLVDEEGSPKAFAEKIGVTRQAVNNWINDTSIPDIERLAVIARLYNLQLSDLLTSDDGLIPQFSDSQWIDRPLYGSIAAGTPLEMLPVDDEYPAPKPIADKYPDGFWLRVSSDSMNLLFPVGTLVYVNPMNDIRVNGKPYALCVNGYDAVAKLVDKTAHGYRLVPASTNPVYVPQEYDYRIPDTDRITVIGEIVYDMKPFDWSY